MLKIESSTGNKLDPPSPMLTESTKSSRNNLQSTPALANLPTISIFVTNNDADLSLDSALDSGEVASSRTDNSNPIASSLINKCHSMMNIKPDDEAAQRIKLNTESFCLLDSKLKTSPHIMLNYELSGGHHHKRPSAYRKSLSRVNLNMYHLQLKPTADTDDHRNSKTQFNESKLISSAMGGGKKQPMLLISGLSSSGSAQYFNKSMTNISNLTRLGLTAHKQSSTNFSTAGQGLYLNPSINQSNESHGDCLFLKRSIATSRSDLFKSSNSLNALDLELLDSVSVGSFDRQSFNSCGANSELDLSYNNCGRFRSSGRNSAALWTDSGEYGSSSNNISKKDASSSNCQEFSLTTLNGGHLTGSKFNSKVMNWLNEN
jgi:hypothetical protein